MSGYFILQKGTCCGVNPFHFLNEIVENFGLVFEIVQKYMFMRNIENMVTIIIYSLDF